MPLLIVGFCCLLVAFLTLYTPFVKSSKPKNKGKSTQFNPVVRYDLSNKKYYIVNADSQLGDIPYTTWYGGKIYYKNKSQAQVEVENMRVDQ